MQTKIYQNGLKLVVDEMKGFETVAFNMLVKTGSANEMPNEYGISHFIEHMMFKGTKKRSSADISKEFNDLGASINAYTSFESTVYYTKSVSENAEKCVEILSDMLFNSTFDKNEMAREKNVVIEEIKSYADDPQSMCELLANKYFYVGTPYARDIAGSISNVKAISQKKMFEYKNKYYTPKNMILSFAGKINLNTADKLVQKYFLPYFKDDGYEVKFNYKNTSKIAYAKAFKDNEQSQVIISFPGLYHNSASNFTAKVFNKAFGVGMSSVLFQSIREKLGLVYSIGSSVSTNNAGGDLSVYFSTSNKNISKALNAVQEEIKKVIKQGLSAQQFESAQKSIVSSIKMQFESTSTVSSFNAKCFSHNELLTRDEYIDKILEVTLDDVNQFVKSHFSKKQFTVAVVGRNKTLDLKKYFKL